MQGCSVGKAVSRTVSGETGLTVQQTPVSAGRNLMSASHSGRLESTKSGISCSIPHNNVAFAGSSPPPPPSCTPSSISIQANLQGASRPPATVDPDYLVHPVIVKLYLRETVSMNLQRPHFTMGGVRQLFISRTITTELILQHSQPHS